MGTYQDKLKDPRWQKKRLEIFERDSWKCTQCGSSTKTLMVHHLEYRNSCEPWDYPNECLSTYCEDCHKIDHKLIPKFKISNILVRCPVCLYEYCHIVKQERVLGNDNYEAWEGRGDLYLTYFDGECGSVFAHCYGEHKGHIDYGVLVISSCKGK
jgi:hypothetical protein